MSAQNSDGKIGAVVAGCGGRGVWFASQAFTKDNYELLGLVDSIPGRAELTREHIGAEGVPVFDSVAEAVERTGCDALLLATPDCEHASGALEALKRGRHVYIEKPMSTTLEDCLSIIRADKDAGGKAFVGFNLRYAPVYRAVRKMMREGRIGRTLTIQTDEFYYGGRTYFRRWNRFRAKGGGLWITKSCHDFDILYWLADSLPKRVCASSALTYYRPRQDAARLCRDCKLKETCPDCYFKGGRIDPDSFTWKMAQLREEAGEDPADLCLWNSEKDTFDHAAASVDFRGDILTTHSVNVVASMSDRRVRVSGTDGMLDGDHRSGTVTYYRRHGAEPEEVELDTSGGHGGGDRKIMDDFAEFVRGRISSPIPPPQAGVAVAIGLAARLSADRRQAVDMDDLEGWRELVDCLSD